MITINDTLHTNADTAMLKAICPDTDSICFFDIETVLLRLPAPRYLPVSAPVSATMKPNMKAVKKKTAVTSNLKLPTPAA